MHFWLKSLAIVAFVLFAQPASLQASPSARPAPAVFDFYVFTLSWSPEFCASTAADRSPEECAVGSEEGFVVHGLWPDNRYAEDPADCGSGPILPSSLQNAKGVYPSDGLARYEYRKHGACTGYSPEEYFQAVKSTREQIVTPDILKAPRRELRLSSAEIRQAFLAANANLRPDNIVVTCSRGELVDVRLCISRDLRAYAVCPEKVLRHSCRSPQLNVAPVR